MAGRYLLLRAEGPEYLALNYVGLGAPPNDGEVMTGTPLPNSLYIKLGWDVAPAEGSEEEQAAALNAELTTVYSLVNTWHERHDR